MAVTLQVSENDLQKAQTVKYWQEFEFKFFLIGLFLLRHNYFVSELLNPSGNVYLGSIRCLNSVNNCDSVSSSK